MKLNSKLILSLVATIPSTLAAVNGRCTGRNGICVATGTCSSYGGTYYTGRCPNDPNNIKCCDNISCRVNGQVGKCMFTSQCSGTTVSGYCPGGNDFKCCLSSPPVDQCKSKGGSCKNPNSCIGTVLNNLCPGGADNKCCVPNDNNCKAQGGECIAPSSCRDTVKGGLCATSGTQCCIPDKCKAQGGSCKNPSSCDGTVLNNLCPGGADNKCCVPNQCKAKGGSCMNPNSCIGTVYNNLCPGGADNKCCVPNDNKCKAQGGECIAPSSCRSTIKIGLCATSGTQCCIPNDDKCKAQGGECLYPSSCRGTTKPGLCVTSGTQCCVPLPPKPDLNPTIYENALTHVGSGDWSKWTSRQCELNDSVYFNFGEFKCNLFVYEVLLASDIDIGTPNHVEGLRLLILDDGKDQRPACASDWYNNDENNMVPSFKLVYSGKGKDGIDKCKQGDVITDGGHMGIISGEGKTISASGLTGKVENNDWGFRDNSDPIKCYRYSP